jgi:hypothetical protein
MVSFSGLLAVADNSASAATVPTFLVHGSMIPAPVAPHLRHIRGAEMSTNWSGYAQTSATNGTFTEVTDTFVVPTITAAAKGNQYAADWVGIGGFSDSTLVQTGIQVVAHTRKHVTTISYDAWTEHLPQPEKPLDELPIKAGDSVTATVQETATNQWLMEVTDNTTGVSQGVPVDYTSSGASAEVIHERPCIRAPCRTRDLARLAQTPNITFGPGSYSTTAPGSTPVTMPLLDTVPGLTLNDIVMTNNQETQSIATPSAPSSSDDGFVVADGSTPPAPPSI